MWQQNWFKADYRPADHRVQPAQPQYQDYRDPPPQIPSSDDESSQSEPEGELLASELAYLTLPEALEFAFKAGVHDDSPRSYANAMRRPDAQKYHEAACDEIQSLLDNGTWELASLPPG